RPPDRSRSPAWSKILPSAPSSTSPQALWCACPAASNCSSSWLGRPAPPGPSAPDSRCDSELQQPGPASQSANRQQLAAGGASHDVQIQAVAVRPYLLVSPWADRSIRPWL